MSSSRAQQQQHHHHHHHHQQTRNYYDILGLRDRPSSHAAIPSAELKQAYRQALLLHHPDKQRSSATAAAGGAAGVASTRGSAPSVDDITEAYRVLADPLLRAAYERSRKFVRADEDATLLDTRHAGMETFDLDDLHVSGDGDGAGAVWTRACRCGSQPAFVITQAELEEHVECGALITGCKGCSLWLEVLFGVAD